MLVQRDQGRNAGGLGGDQRAGELHFGKFRLSGHQDHFVMVNGAQAMRPLPYFTGIFRLADQAGLLRDPALAVKRMKQLLAVYGV